MNHHALMMDTNLGGITMANGTVKKIPLKNASALNVRPRRWNWALGQTNRPKP